MRGMAGCPRGRLGLDFVLYLRSSVPFVEKRVTRLSNDDRTDCNLRNGKCQNRSGENQ